MKDRPALSRTTPDFASCSRRLVQAAIAVAFALTLPLIAQQSPASLVGVYHCTQGFTLTISRCGNVRGLDVCLFKIENKGQVLMNSAGSLTGMRKAVKKCTGEAAEAPSGTPQSRGPGATNPPYLSEMPPPARILAEIKGKDAEDTGERQMGAFRALVQMIDDMAWGLSHRYVDDADTRAATPDEERLRLAYETAYANVRKTVTNKDGHVYDRDRNLHNELLHNFFSESFRAQYFQANRNAQADYNAFMDKLSAKPANAGSQQSAASGTQPGMRNDAGSVAVRHCMESGRSETECLGEGFKASLKELNGGHSLTEGLVPETPTGLRLTGIYRTQNFALTFQQDSVTVGCGTLIPQSRLYTVVRNGLHILVTVPISPKPLVLTYRADGKLVGPGPVLVAGQVVTGGMRDSTSTGFEMKKHSTTTQTQLEDSGTPYYDPGGLQQNGSGYSKKQTITSYEMTPTTVHHYSVPTAPKTERCNAGSLAPTGQAPSVSGTLTTVLGSQASRSSNVALGLRLNGIYAAPAGLKIEFREDSATLECGDARNSEGYAVVPEGGGLIVKFQNNTVPLSLILQPDGALSGPAMVEVAGRVVTGHNGNEILYAPRSARCSLGTLVLSK